MRKRTWLIVVAYIAGWLTSPVLDTLAQKQPDTANLAEMLVIPSPELTARATHQKTSIQSGNQLAAK